MPISLPLAAVSPTGRTFGTGSFNGLSFGPGTSYNVAMVQGVDDLPGIRHADTPRTSDPGYFRGTDYLDGRSIMLQFHLIAADNLGLQTLVDNFKTAFNTSPGLGEQPLTFYSGTRQMAVRCRKRTVPYDMTYARRTATATVELFATDPRVYDSTLQTATLGLPIATGGLTWPTAWPASWGSASAGGSAVCNNAGNAATRPVVVIAGPVDSPTIENLTSGQHLSFSISLANGDTLTVDLDAHSVVLNGTASRRGTMTSDSAWFEFAPGNNNVNYRANTSQTGSTATVTWRSAWT